MVLQDLHSQGTVRTFILRVVTMQVRSKVRGMHCFVLKPKQDYLFNFPNPGKRNPSKMVGVARSRHTETMLTENWSI